MFVMLPLCSASHQCLQSNLQPIIWDKPRGGEKKPQLQVQQTLSFKNKPLWFYSGLFSRRKNSAASLTNTQFQEKKPHCFLCFIFKEKKLCSKFNKHSISSINPCVFSALLSRRKHWAPCLINTQFHEKKPFLVLFFREKKLGSKFNKHSVSTIKTMGFFCFIFKEKKNELQVQQTLNFIKKHLCFSALFSREKIQLQI